MLQPITMEHFLIQKIEILKMASTMAVSKASKTYMTDIIDQKHFNFDFLWMFRSTMIQTNKLEHGFDSASCNLKMASKMAISKAPKKHTKNILDIKHFNFDFLSIFRSLIIQTFKTKHSQV